MLRKRTIANLKVLLLRLSWGCVALKVGGWGWEGTLAFSYQIIIIIIVTLLDLSWPEITSFAFALATYSQRVHDYGICIIRGCLSEYVLQLLLLGRILLWPLIGSQRPIRICLFMVYDVICQNVIIIIWGHLHRLKNTDDKVIGLHWLPNKSHRAYQSIIVKSESMVHKWGRTCDTHTYSHQSTGGRQREGDGKDSHVTSILSPAHTHPPAFWPAACCNSGSLLISPVIIRSTLFSLDLQAQLLLLEWHPRENLIGPIHLMEVGSDSRWHQSAAHISSHIQTVGCHEQRGPASYWQECVTRKTITVLSSPGLFVTSFCPQLQLQPFSPPHPLLFIYLQFACKLTLSISSSVVKQLLKASSTPTRYSCVLPRCLPSGIYNFGTIEPKLRHTQSSSLDPVGQHHNWQLLCVLNRIDLPYCLFKAHGYLVSQCRHVLVYSNWQRFGSTCLFFT